MLEAALVVDNGRDICRLRPLWEQVPEGWALWIVATGEAVRGEAGSAVRILTAATPRVRTVAMFEKNRQWEEAVAVAVHGFVAVLRRLGVRVILTYGPTAGGLAAAIAAKLLAIPQLHITRGDEDHPFRATSLLPKLAATTIPGPSFIPQPARTTPKDGLLCLLDPYNTTKYRRLYERVHTLLSEYKGSITLVCPAFDKLALRPLRALPTLIHKRCMDYEGLLEALAAAELFVTNTEVAHLEARVCGVPTLLVDEWGGRRLEGGRRCAVGMEWPNRDEVWSVAASFRMGRVDRGLRRG